MANYFNIQPITISVNTPFDFKTITAIRWAASYVPRGPYESSIFKCALLDQNQVDVYYWDLQIPPTVIEQWLDDSVIDDYICSTDSRFVKI